MLELRSAEHARQAAHTYRAAMAACQADVDPVRANCSNPQTRSRYADLAALDGAIRPVYTAHGFSLSFDTIASERPDYVRIVCKVYHSGGHCETHGLDVPGRWRRSEGRPGHDQSARARQRLHLCTQVFDAMAFNIAIDRDDDANYAGTRTRPTPPQPPERSETARNSSRNDTPHDIDGVVIEGDHELRAPHDHQSRHKVMTTGVEHRRQAQSRQTAASQSICEDGTGGVGSRKRPRQHSTN
jgi:hypothetical protein